jgi:hypothetical protein
MMIKVFSAVRLMSLMLKELAMDDEAKYDGLGEACTEPSPLADEPLIEIYDGSDLVGTAASVGGVWSWSSKSLDPGLHEMEARMGHLRSQKWFFTVRKLQLTAPRILEVFMEDRVGVSNSLNLLKAIDHATVVVKYPDMLPGDLVTMTWAGSGAGGSVSESKSVASSDGLEFLVPYPYLSNNIGGRVSVSFSVLAADNQEQVRSPAVEFLVTNDGLRGTASFITGTTSYYHCAPRQSTLYVNNSSETGVILGETSLESPSAVTSFKKEATYTSAFRMSVIGPQPPITSVIFPTKVEGVGMKLTWGEPFLEAGPGNAGVTGNAGKRSMIQFIKTGLVKPGVMDAEDVVEWRAGTNRLHFMSFRLTSPVTVVVI